MTQRRLFCDDAPVSYEATDADQPRPRTTPAVPADAKPVTAPRYNIGQRLVCNDNTVSYDVIEDDIRI